MLAHVVFMEDAADPVEPLVMVVAMPVELRVACDAEASDVIDLRPDDCLSANLISLHLTLHQQSLRSASKASFR